MHDDNNNNNRVQTIINSRAVNKSPFTTQTEIVHIGPSDGQEGGSFIVRMQCT